MSSLVLRMPVISSRHMLDMAACSTHFFRCSAALLAQVLHNPSGRQSKACEKGLRVSLTYGVVTSEAISKKGNLQPVEEVVNTDGSGEMLGNAFGARSEVSLLGILV